MHTAKSEQKHTAEKSDSFDAMRAGTVAAGAMSNAGTETHETHA